MSLQNKKDNSMDTSTNIKQDVEDFDTIVKNSYDNGFKDAAAKTKLEIINILKSHAVNLFLANEDYLAREIRKCLSHIENKVEG
mgnify:CR=1 FL=1